MFSTFLVAFHHSVLWLEVKWDSVEVFSCENEHAATGNTCERCSGTSNRYNISIQERLRAHRE